MGVADGRAYRVYFFNDAGRIVGVRELPSHSDAEALREVKGYVHPYAIEVWDRARLVARVEPRNGRRRPSK